MENQYSHKVQKLYKISGFGLIKNNQPGDLDQALLKNIVFEAKELALMMISLVLGVGLISRSPFTSHLTSMKLVAILVIICRLAY